MWWQKAAVPSVPCIAVVKFLECKLGAGLMYPSGTYVWKIYSTFCEFEVKMTQHFSVFEVKMTLTDLASSYLALLPYYDSY